MPGKDLWDRIALKIGYDHSAIKSEVTGESGEAAFKKIAFKRSQNANVLDVGCADGRFTLEVAHHAKKVAGIDSSSEMIKKSMENQRSRNGNNASFAVMDCRKLLFPEGRFDLVISRRGPATSSTACLRECFRVLASGGWFVELTIGEKDCIEMEEIFGRRQMGKFSSPLSRSKTDMLKKAGFMEIFSKEFVYTERFASVDDLITLLETTPIIPGFSMRRDRKAVEYLLKKYGANPVEMTRHRVFLGGTKP